MKTAVLLLRCCILHFTSNVSSLFEEPDASILFSRQPATRHSPEQENPFKSKNELKFRNKNEDLNLYVLTKLIHCRRSEVLERFNKCFRWKFVSCSGFVWISVNQFLMFSKIAGRICHILSGEYEGGNNRYSTCRVGI
jgi:hypothetical protein